MNETRVPRLRRLCVIVAALLAPVAVQHAACAQAWMHDHPGFHHEQDRDHDHDRFGPRLHPGDLLLSTTVFARDANLVAGVTQLPPGCAGNACVTAVASGEYPYVFNNASVDGNFGITSKIELLELDPDGRAVASIEVPNSTQPGVSAQDDQMVTSFSSKSELALNLSPDGHQLSFMGYEAPVAALDVSNSNTPGVNDSSNPLSTPEYYRVIARVGADGRFHFTRTNAFSGDNGRAAITARVNGVDLAYMAGNSADSDTAYIEASGAQIAPASDLPESAQQAQAPTPVGSFNISELGLSEKGDTAKDNNYRGMAIEDGVLYYSKGSGGKGVNTVYFVDTSGSACASSSATGSAGGVGLPAAGAMLPTQALGAGGFGVSNGVLQPLNMCILAGFPSALNNGNPNPMHPFGLWFANDHTLYVADEGTGDNTYSGGSYVNAASGQGGQQFAGLQKWVLNPSTHAWTLAYVLQAGLDLGQPYAVSGYPTGINPVAQGGTGLPWAPATDGLRAVTGRVDRHGLVTLYAVTSTVSGSGDQGADPNKLVVVTDRVDATQPGTQERFRTLRIAPAGTLFRGVSWAPRARGFAFGR